MTAGSFNPAEVINGYLSNEGAALLGILGSGMGVEVGSLNQTAFRALISGFLKFTDPVLVESTAFVYTDSSKFDNPEAEYSDSSSDFFGDTLFACSGNALTRNLANAGRSVYFYLMTHAPSMSIWGQSFSNLGATHGEDIPYVFGTSLVEGIVEEELQHHFTEEEVSMSMEIMRYWSNFAKTGDPNRSSQGSEETSTSGYPAWPKSTELDPTYKEFSPTFANHKGFPRAKECLYWEKIFPLLMQTSMELSGLKSTLEEKVEADSGKSCTDPESCPEKLKKDSFIDDTP